MTKRLGIAAVLAALCPIAASTAKEGKTDKPAKEFMGLPLVYADEFDKPAPQKWEPTDKAAWTFTKDGDRTVYALARKSKYRPKVRSPYGISLLKDVWLSDFVMDAWLRSTCKEYGHRDMCLFFGHQDLSHFYYIHIATKADPHANSVFLVNDKPRLSIAKERNKGTHWSEGYHHVRLVRKVESGTIEVYFDDMRKPIMKAEDKTFRWGRVGVGSFDDTGNVDRIRLWGKKVTPPAAAKRAAPERSR